MHKHFLIMAISLLALLSHSCTLGMITYKDLGHPDIQQNICKYLSKEDQDDFRLVCKDWARKNEQWRFMPDSVEKEYDKIIQNKSIHTTKLILFTLTAKNDLNAIQWITRNHPSTSITIRHGNDYTLFPHMLAIHNKNREIARLLLEIEYKNKNWKICYNTITLPMDMELCLDINNNRDFSFLFYFIAVVADDTDTLQQLYAKKIPTPTGQRLLLQICLQFNAINCLDILVKNEPTNKIISEEGLLFFQHSFTRNNKEIARKLIDTKLYDINKRIDVMRNLTILDYYYYDENRKKDKFTQALLEDLGAKTWEMVKREEAEKNHCYCTIL